VLKLFRDSGEGGEKVVRGGGDGGHKGSGLVKIKEELRVRGILTLVRVK